jgi:hypothetical protein
MKDANGLRGDAPCLHFRAEEVFVAKLDVQELGERMTRLAEKVDRLRRFL